MGKENIDYINKSSLLYKVGWPQLIPVPLAVEEDYPKVNNL